MTRKNIPVVNVIGWDILKLNTPGLIGINFESDPKPTGEAFNALTLEMAKQLIEDLQRNIAVLENVSGK